MQPTNTYYGGGGGPSFSQITKPRNKRRAVFLAVGILLVILTVALGIISAMQDDGRSQQSFSDSFVEKYVKGEADATYALLSPETQSIESKEEWTSKVNETKDFFSTYKRSEDLYIDSEGAAEDSNTEIYTYVALGKDGTYAFTIAVSKEDANQGVVSFSSVPYIDAGGALK